MKSKEGKAKYEDDKSKVRLKDATQIIRGDKQ